LAGSTPDTPRKKWAMIMKALVVYESMFGNTRQIAEAIAAGLAESVDVAAVEVSEATAEAAEGADLLVAGGPTHWSTFLVLALPDGVSMHLRCHQVIAKLTRRG
jgi:flavorubredoxin